MNKSHQYEGIIARRMSPSGPAGRSSERLKLLTAVPLDLDVGARGKEAASIKIDQRRPGSYSWKVFTGSYYVSSASRT